LFFVLIASNFFFFGSAIHVFIVRKTFTACSIFEQKILYE